jgi:hypothetical protein
MHPTRGGQHRRGCEEGEERKAVGCFGAAGGRKGGGRRRQTEPDRDLAAHHGAELAAVELAVLSEEFAIFCDDVKVVSGEMNVKVDVTLHVPLLDRHVLQPLSPHARTHTSTRTQLSDKSDAADRGRMGGRREKEKRACKAELQIVTQMGDLSEFFEVQPSRIVCIKAGAVLAVCKNKALVVPACKRALWVRAWVSRRV